jgi:hypothetical protein
VRSRALVATPQCAGSPLVDVSGPVVDETDSAQLPDFEDCEGR